MLKITNLSLLKITKVKDWAIFFDYDDKHYLLHENNSGETYHELYERKLNKYGGYKLEYISSKISNNSLIGEYIRKRKPIVYSQINKELFIYYLTKNDFISSHFDTIVEDQRRQREELEKEILLYENKIREIREKIRNI